MAKDRLSGKLAVILHADIAGSTQMVQLNEQLAHERIQDTFHRIGDLIKRYHGHVRELRGDAILAQFERASDALTAALAFQAEQVNYNTQINDDIRPTVRAGIAMGEVVIADDTVTGEGVVLAQRLEQLAKPGGTVIQGAAYETIPGRFPFEYADLGQHELKGFNKPVRAFSASLKNDANLPLPEQADHRFRYLRFALIGIFAIAISGTLLWFNPREVREEPASIERMTLPLPDRPSIAVLPFEMLGDEFTSDYLGDGLSNDLITALSKFSNLFVISSHSSFFYKGKLVKAQTVSEELGVRYVLKGSVQKSTERLRTNAQLIDALSGRHLWAERFDRKTNDFLTIQDEIVESVVANLAIQVDAAERERVKAKHANNLEAYDYYLRANDIRFDWDKATNHEARQLLEKAIELDPNYARAYSALAWTHVNDWRWGWTKDLDASRTLALETARKAAELDPFDPDSHHAVGVVHLYSRDFDKAISLYKKAIALNPNDARRLVGTAPAWIYLGQTKEAVAQIERALRLNPHHSDDDLNFLGWAYYEAREYEKALATLKKIEKSPWHAVLAATYVRLGRMEEARAEVKTVLKNNPEYSLERGETFPYKYDDQKKHYYDALEKAGMPKHPPLKLPDKPSIAVLPFTNMSDDPKQEYFADGMTEDLITDISKISGLKVIARHSTFSYKGQNPDVRDVGRELGASHVIEGSVRKAGNTIRITIQLVDASDGKHVWAERYDRELSDVFAIQDEVIGEIITALSLKLTPEEEKRITKHDTENLAAYDLFMRGRQQESIFTRESFIEAQRYYEQAVALDRNYAEAWARLAQIHTLNGQFGWVEDILSADQRALDLVEKSINLDPDSPFIRYGYSRILSRDSIGQHDRAIEEAKRAIELDPNFADAYAWLGQLFILTGQAEKTITPITTAMRINPNFPFWYHYTYGFAHYFMAKFDEAAENIEKAAERNPNVMFIRTAFAASLAMADRQDDAEWQIDELYSLGFDNTLDEHIKESPIQDPAYRALFREGLAKAGLL